LFSWRKLTASQLKSLMRIANNDEMPLYMSRMLDILRRIQKSGKIIPFGDFKSLIQEENFLKQQSAPLEMRLQILESFLKESDQNMSLNFDSISLSELFLTPNTIVVSDLTDPMLSPQEASGVFQVLLSQFLSLDSKNGKLVVFDEAHKYMIPNSRNDELTMTILSTVRQMRHHGIRIIISSQSPKSIAPELLELVTVAFIHRFHSPDWYHYLREKIPYFDEKIFSQIIQLRTGAALVFSKSWSRTLEPEAGKGLDRVNIRVKLTQDSGNSKI